MQSWNLLEIETPDGSRSPVVLYSKENESRTVLIGLHPGQELGDHEVKEGAMLVVIEGTIHVESGGTSLDAGPGTFVRFEPQERHSVSSEGGARLLLLLAPWPGPGHYRGEQRSDEAVSAD